MKRDAPRIVLFGSGSPLSLAAFDALRAFELVAVVVPGGPATADLRGWIRRRSRSRASAELAARAARAGCMVLTWQGAATPLAEALRSLSPHLLCVASFPRLLPAVLLEVPRLAAIGLHPSLLPRHRGPDPLFWTYVGDDAVSGVSVHHLDEREDAGDLIAQESLALTRGRPVADLYAELSVRGAGLLAPAVGGIWRRGAQRTPQDGLSATREGRPGDWRIDAAGWPAERVWHVLSGLAGTRALLADAAGHTIPHGRGLRFRLAEHGLAPGTIETRLGLIRVHCRDGVVEVERAAWRHGRLLSALGGLLR